MASKKTISLETNLCPYNESCSIGPQLAIARCGNEKYEQCPQYIHLKDEEQKAIDEKKYGRVA